MPSAPDTRLPRLWAVLLALNLTVLILPLAGLALLRTYDRQLVRQTESELFVQGAFIVESYRQAFASAAGSAAPLASPLLRPGDAQAAPGAAEPLDPAARDDLAASAALPAGEEAIAPSSAPGEDDRLDALVGAALTPVLERAALQTLAGIRLVDTRGVVVATSRSELALSLGARAEVQAALRGQVNSLLRRRQEKARDAPLSSASRNTGVRVFVALPVAVDGKVRGAVVLSRTPMTLGKAFYQDRYYLLITALVQLGAVLVLSLIAARVVIRPVRALAEQARAIADGRDDVGALPPPRTREVAALADAVTRMGGALQQRADAIRAFATNVSHEFKTPLASLGATVELLQDQLATMEPAQRDRFLELLAADAARLNLLVDRLLELARADVARPGAARAELQPLLAALAKRERRPGFSIELELPAEPLAVRMAPELLDAALANLIGNAQRHGGATRVSIRAARRGGLVELAVANDGAAISAGNRARVFDAFFTTARAQGGTGLGLTIVQALLKAHQGEIRLLEQPAGAERGVAFSIALPAA